MSYRVLIGDCIEQMRTLPDRSVHCCVTSPPYFGLRDYGHADQIGLEATPDAFVAKLVEVFREVRRVLRDDGTLWLNLGDSYAAMRDSKVSPDTLRGDETGTAVGAGMAANRNPVTLRASGLKHKDLIGIPWRVAFALQADGWYLRQDIIWHKPNPMPESVTDRCTKAHEYIFMLTKSARYWYDAEAIKEPSSTPLAPPDANGSTINGSPHGRHVLGAAIPEKGRRPDMNSLPDGQSNLRKARDKHRGHGRRHAGFNDRWDAMSREEQGSLGRNKRSVWTVATRPYAGAHFATFPPDLIRPCILAGCPTGGTVLDPFGGSGTTAEVSVQEGRNAILCELNTEYVPLIHNRLSGLQIKIYDHAENLRD